MARSEKRITQADLAEAAGVSRMAVSYALRNDLKMVSKETIERIHKLAEEMGYRPNPLVSSLMTHVKRSRVNEVRANIAVTFWGFEADILNVNPSMQKIHRSILKQADRYGYGVETYHVGHDDMSPERVYEVLRARGISGVLLLMKRNHEVDDFFPLDEFACATSGFYLRSMDLNRVCIDHLEMIRSAGLKLRDRGYERIGMMIETYHDRRLHVMTGCYHALRQSIGFETTADLCISDGYPSSVEKYVNENDLDGLILASSSLAKNFIRSTNAVPDRLGVISLDVVEPILELAAMEPGWSEIGVSMVDLVVGQLNLNQRGIPESRKTVLVPSIWHDGGSIRPEH